MSVDVNHNFEPVNASGFSLVDMLLDEQRQPTAVETFARLQVADRLPTQEKYYRELLPLSPPRPGEQYAFEVDLDRCSGCKACVTACHTLNGLDENEVWRDVGLLHGGTTDLPVLQHVTTACHHCLEPACLIACPVNAYEKDPLTGIVKHLDDQCFGCQYCVLACPYDVPKFNKKKGIVRKCDMCSQRLAVGEAPACVQACPHEAIRIKVVDRQDVAHDCESSLFLPGAPDPQLTLPTTNYKSRRPLPRNTLPVDYFRVRREDSHLPLVLMLVLTQLSVGAFLIDLLLKSIVTFDREVLFAVHPVHCAAALLFGVTALASSTCHLGRPLYAFRAVLGLRHSWLSREIVAFGLFSALAGLYACSSWLWPTAQENVSLTKALGAAVVGSGVLAVFCSAMVYQATRRPFWNAVGVNTKFFLTTAWLGLAAALLTSMIAVGWSGSLSASQALTAYGELLCKLLLGVSAAKLTFESLTFLHLRAKHTTPLKRTALLLVGPLAGVTWKRFGLGAVGGLALPALLLQSQTFRPGPGFSDQAIALIVSGLFLASLAGELLERYLFFVAAVAPRMPGGLA
ncbi:MAG: dimethyl sulfoxide reductase anchor subunit [Planctomycetia bacterium]|nr:dimethyl sulfoxide reductase anchor subunit [Planctomycetia bacterium]